jgi:hypothetical protein
VLESSLATVPSAAQATTAQNAAKVDGLDANALTRVAYMGTPTALGLTSADQKLGKDVSITAPRAGFVMVHAGVTTANESFTTNCTVTSSVYHRQSGDTSNLAQATLAAQAVATTSHAWVFPVNAGLNIFELRVRQEPGDGVLSAKFGELAAIYTPFGPTGGG